MSTHIHERRTQWNPNSDPQIERLINHKSILYEQSLKFIKDFDSKRVRFAICREIRERGGRCSGNFERIPIKRGSVVEFLRGLYEGFYLWGELLYAFFLFVCGFKYLSECPIITNFQLDRE